MLVKAMVSLNYGTPCVLVNLSTVNSYFTISLLLIKSGVYR